MVEASNPKLSIVRQCDLLGISRSGRYYQPLGENAESLALMRLMDETYMDCPYYGARQMKRHLHRLGHKVGRHRVARLMKQGAHSEWPRSLGTRAISNVRLLADDHDGIRVGSVFTTYRSKEDRTDTYFGHHLHVLREVDGVLKIVSKVSLLAMGSLRPHGRISIIL